MTFNDPEVKQLAPSDISLRVYTDHKVHILGKYEFYMLHPDMKKPNMVIFYTVNNEGSVLLSCTTLLALDLIQTRPHLDYLSRRATLINSTADHPDTTNKTADQGKATFKQSSCIHKTFMVIHTCIKLFMQQSWMYISQCICQEKVRHQRILYHI